MGVFSEVKLPCTKGDIVYFNRPDYLITIEKVERVIDGGN